MNKEVDKENNHVRIGFDFDDLGRTGVRKSQQTASNDDEGFACSILPSSQLRHAGTTNLKGHRLSNYDKLFARSDTHEYKSQIKKTSGFTVITTVLLAASLFSAFLIHFLGQTYNHLRGNGPQLSSATLVDISNKLYAISLNQAILTAPVPLADTGSTTIPLSGATTPQWLVSLALLLGAAVTGIMAKRRLFRYLG